MKGFLFWLAAAALLPGTSASGAGVIALQPRAYNELFWAAKWARWERSCKHSDALRWFTRKYGTRFQTVRLRYTSMFAESQFPELPPELVDGTIVWSCRTGRHSDQKRKFVRILNEQEVELGLSKR